MPNLCDNILNKIKNFDVPKPSSSSEKTLYLILGIVNIFIFGLGMIIIGALRNDTADLIIGVLQLVLPFVGWVWALIWGVLIILKAVK